MISPHELKEKSFQRAVRGYSIQDVDEYFEFLIDKYTELYRENAELEKQLHVVNSKYNEISNEEQSIRETLLKAQKLSERIIENATKEASAKEAEAEKRCEEIVAETKKKIADERAKLEQMSADAEEFRDKLYGQFIAQIKHIKEMDIVLPDNFGERIISDEEISKRVLNTSSDASGENSGSGDDASSKTFVFDEDDAK